ncbi:MULTISPECIES: hypothetical protein [Olivibacter]|uniref:Uncharacterized protein n=1 Tax=Olivibacter oleidegradans TaxID=760123 RepID=A0ABV6HIK9_9SPHI|nr:MULTISPECIES: hypothetical protein [Olivibacter]MDM8175929.1 hypothetical protein [Olivibacter sp. 47]
MKFVAYILISLILTVSAVYVDNDNVPVNSVTRHEHSKSNLGHDKCASQCNISVCFHFINLESEIPVFASIESPEKPRPFNVRFAKLLSSLEVWQPPKSIL